MTNIELTEKIATMIMHDDDIDLIDAIDAAATLFTPTAFIDLCNMLDICNIHRCDMQICIDDDDAECAHLPFRNPTDYDAFNE